jgi:hypothetical protein
MEDKYFLTGAQPNAFEVDASRRLEAIEGLGKVTQGLI